MAIGIGCGSWADPEYAGLLYPKAFPPDLRLCGYAMWFDHVEVNATYYALPRTEAVKNWVAQTPSHFRFDLRLPRAISQGPAKAGKDGRMVDLLLKGVAPLIKTGKLGAFLMVLSPSFQPGKHKLDELDALIERLRPHALAVELRHAAWVTKKSRASTLGFFRERKLTWVAVDMPPIVGSDLMPPVDEVTDPELAYLRLHGRNLRYVQAKSAEERHRYAYTDTDLKDLVRRIRALERKARNVRVVANNHAADFAPLTALALRDLLGA